LNEKRMRKVAISIQLHVSRKTVLNTHDILNNRGCIAYLMHNLLELL
jgi:Mn-dependent DtxR family transcriptional regulator